MAGNFAADLETVFAVNQTKPCFHLPDGGVWTFADLLDAIARLAGALLDLGVKPGERLLAQVDKTPEAVALYIATLKVGAVYVPLNTAYTEAEVAHFVRDAAPRAFVRSPTAPPLAPSADLAVLRLGGEGGELRDLMASDAAFNDVIARRGDDLAALVYTSGTTGRSKGAMLTHRNIRSNAHALRECWGWRDDDVLLHALPIFHVHGLFIALHCALLGATPTIFLSRFHAAEVQRRLPEATVMMGVPTYYSRLLQLPDFGRSQCAGVRLFISGSAPLTEQVFHAWEARTGHRILERYGMSETIINTSNPLRGPRVPGTVGFPLPGVEVRIADEKGAALPPGTVGGIEVRGENVCKGYWRRPDKTAAEFRRDGFFVTGDLGLTDAEGRLSIVGRGKDLIITGGYNVYPKEVETLLDTLAGVVESAIIGAPHGDFGEAVLAVVVPSGPDLSLEQVNGRLKGRLARFKQPKAVVNVAALPRNAMGKVQKSLLRSQFAQVFAQPG